MTTVKTIYLGESVPIDSLMDMRNHFDNIVYIAYMTIEPTREAVDDYVTEINTKIEDTNSQICFIGRMTEFIDDNRLPECVFVFKSISDSLIRVTSILKFLIILLNLPSVVLSFFKR